VLYSFIGKKNKVKRSFVSLAKKDYIIGFGIYMAILVLNVYLVRIPYAGLLLGMFVLLPALAYLKICLVKVSGQESRH
jgi:hypothetical protein